MNDTLTYPYIHEAFQYLEDWESRYQFIIDLGNKLPSMPEEFKNTHTRIHQCMSMVWIYPYLSEDGTVAFHGHSDTDTIKGIVAILIAIYAGKLPQEIVQIDTDDKFEELGLFDHLSPTRHVGVYAMVEQTRKQVGEL
ncbi:MAG: cysteine desulfuration protein SufE [Parasphingorhabdus sp.]|jgi:cysteine desulfuration protein SufE